MKIASLLVCNWLAIGATVSAEEPNAKSNKTHNGGSVGQLYFYALKDRPAFEEGYRRHLSWHAAQNDKLVWYAWTIDSGPRKGDFVDGTLGATFEELDARPNPSGDGADFRRNAAPFVTALDIETWELWALPSTAIPLEERRPETDIDLFFLQIDPAKLLSFEATVEKLAKTKRTIAKLTWYRVARGNDLPMYVVLFSRANLAEIGSAGATLSEMLGKSYASSPAELAEVLGKVRSYRAETWSYEPRLTLIPGQPLQP